MKKIFSLLLAGSLVFGISAIANAQPPEPAPAALNNQHWKRSPEETIGQFLNACSSGALPFITDLVEGVNLNNPSSPAIQKAVNASLGNFVLDAENIKTSPDGQNPGLITATFTLDFRDYAMGFRIQQNDSVQLKRHFIRAGIAGADNEYWSIVPGNPQKYFYSTNDQRSGFTEKLATLIAYPKQMLPQIYLHQSEVQLKQLGLAFVMFTQDYNERIDVTQEDFKKRLTPYMKNASIFTAPDDPLGTTSFNINPNIVGLPMSAFTDVDDTVAFYLGKDQKLDFRYDGLSPVCFLDGHVEAVTPEEAKNLQWKP